MGRNPINNRLHTLRDFVSLTVCGTIVCMLTVSIGCSKLGSQQRLDQRNFPFNNSTAQSAIETPLERASKHRQLRRDQQANHVPNNPVREEVRDVQTITKRPPKLSTMPKMTLYAEPTVTDASQVSFEQEVAPVRNETATATQSAFDPTAEPPAQIFAQPVKALPVEQGPAARVASSRTLAPMLFNPKTREVNSSFEGNLRDGQLRVASSTRRKFNPIKSRETLEPLLVVDAQPEVQSAPPAPTRLAEISPFPIDPEMKTMEITPDRNPVVSSEAFVSSTTITPTQTLNPIKESTNAPIVDSTMGSSFDNLQPPSTPRVIESDLVSQSNTDTSDTVHDNSGHGIRIDADLTRDFEAFRDSPAPQAEPEIEMVEQPSEPVVTKVASLPPPLPTIEALPVLDPPAEELLIQSTPAVENNQVAESDFEPLPAPAKGCANCDQETCLGCELPETAVFAEHVPNFDPGRNIVPMPVDVASLESVDLIKQNFSSTTFSPTDLPLPNDRDVSIDTSENQFLAMEFENTVDHGQVTPSDVAPVGVEALAKLNAVTWRSRLAQTVDLVQDQLNQKDIDSDTRTSLEVNLRLLDVLSRQMGDLVENQQQFSSSENQYWQDQLEAITSMLKVADPVNGRANELFRHHTAHETLTHLRNAVAHLESLANLRVVAGEFCTEVSGYGQFQPFAYNVFPVGQKVLVYCEVENFNSSPQESETGVSYLTRLRGSYAIYNSSGHAVQQAEFPTLEDVARKRRRDFYMHLPVTIGSLAPGNYELHLLIEDLGGNKTASLTPPLQFSVEDTPPVARQAKR